ncbi:MAG TPA: tetratricopeptide repeat protein [Thermoanaerobaculia bacterium]|nr:tetratricopeptide repeat protein [Thermoanaerobaculia bacterium]
MPRIVTASHPSEADLLNLAAGRKAEGLEECRRHLESGCRLCDVRLAELAELVESVREEEAFDALLEGDGLPALPEFGGQKLDFRRPAPQLEDIYRLAQSAEPLAEGLLAAAGAGDAELDEALRALYGNPSRGFALLYACQKGNALVVKAPLGGRGLARAVLGEARSLMDANTEARLATPAPRESVQAEAKLLESQAQNLLGYSVEARAAAAEGREFFRASGDVGFGLALADYYEGSAASFAKDYVAGERLLKKALKVFAEFGQDNLIARAESALGLLCIHRGDEARSLAYLDHAIELFDPVEDARFLTATLINRAMALLRLRRLDEARTTYAKALSVARKLQMKGLLVNIRSGLAQIDIQRQEYGRALRAFQELARDERAAGWTEQAFISELYVAECLGRLGREEEMGEAILALRAERKVNPFGPSPAMEELFSCLDQGALDADLVAHVRTYLVDETNGVQREYRPLRLAG